MAIPGILQQLARTNPMMQQIRKMIGVANASQNPQAVINQLIMNNPQLKPVMDAINAAGGDPKKAYYQMAEKMGVDPNEVMNMLNGQI